MQKAISPAFVFVFGLLIGSFLNVCIYRIPRHISILFPGSTCPSCKRKLKWWHLLPVISFLFLKGKCYYCRKNISWIYPLVELATAFIFSGLFYLFRDPGMCLFISILLCSLLVIGIIDFNFFIIPNKILLFMLLIGFTMNQLLNVKAWDSALFGIFISGSLLIVIRFTGNRIFNQESLGWGDVKLGGVIGFYLGFWHFLLALLVGSIMALIISLFFQKTGADNTRMKIPFAPYLAAGTFLVILIYQYFPYQLF